MPWVLTAQIALVQWRCPECGELTAEAEKSKDCCIHTAEQNLREQIQAPVELEVVWPNGAKAVLSMVEVGSTQVM